jgi:iduronate 2-sulfatase
MRAMLARLPEAKPQVAGVKPLTAKQIQDRAALFARKDKNHDNQLTREEFLANQPDPAEAPKRFERFDTNKDGILSRDEFIHMGTPLKR